MRGGALIARQEINGARADLRHATLLHKYGYLSRAGYHIGWLYAYQQSVPARLFLYHYPRAANVGTGPVAGQQQHQQPNQDAEASVSVSVHMSSAT
ncbi:hypothetical protein GCM10027578_45180 [Spirosoma luteolum]